MDTTQAFIEAVKGGNVVRINELLANDATLVNARTQRGESALLLAVYYQQPEVASLLLLNGSHLDIFEACAIGKRERVANLLHNDPELVNAYAPDGFTPLGLAAFFHHAEVVELLLAKGADANLAARNAQHVKPLHSAVAGQDIASTQALLAHGADINARQEGAFTPLQGAAQNGQIAMVALLLDHGADINATAANGETALSLAIARGHHNIVKLLQQCGANR